MSNLTQTETRERTSSHREYLDTLRRPTTAEARRITNVQIQKEGEIERKYHATEEHDAATRIQKAYRGHRARREINGFTLDSSSRWLEIIREWRFRSATTSLQGQGPARTAGDGLSRAASDVAKLNWQRVGQIAERASAGETSPTFRESRDYLSVTSSVEFTESQEVTESMLMDMRYFLEMVDQKHRYGTNLQVYHEEWLCSKINENFFYWLDHGDGKHLNLPGCSREKLDKERIRYLSKEERLDYLVTVDSEGKLRWKKNGNLITTSADQFMDSRNGIVPKESQDVPVFSDKEVVRQLSDDGCFARRVAHIGNSMEADFPDDSNESSIATDGPADSHMTHQTTTNENKYKKSFHVSPATILNHLLRASIKPGTWIYVADTVGRLYVGIKSSGAFQHASFLSGARISSAGAIGIENGQLSYLSPLSGHYRPTTKSFRVFVDRLKSQGVDLSQLKVSKAFEILLGMEYYGRTKKGVRRIVKGKQEDGGARSRSPELDEKFHIAMDDLSATNLVEQSWEREHRRGLGKLMDDLHIHRHSFDAKKDGR